ncbi:MAG TPA: hypothetical protein PK167_04095 [Prolixibacteraceae bacterium]|nr:hypothetical protein [Prolixibacteraceae bacterium]
MKKIKEGVRQAWHWLDGKKLVIGGVMYLLKNGINIIAPGAISPDANNYIDDVLNFWIFGSVLHKGLKTENGKKWLGIKTNPNAK